MKLSELCRRTRKTRRTHRVPLRRVSPAVPIDQIEIQQVFINLIVNAIEALEGQQMPALVTVRAAVTDSDRMLVQVIDNGPGVHDPEQIFDAFMTTKEKGMGIGLAVSRSIVEAHGGGFGRRITKLAVQSSTWLYHYLMRVPRRLKSRNTHELDPPGF
ncbi:sensor histidine kinase [Tunturiibacter gelidiferens]|uniref:sensor histidine kinase n=1 Tax=Tunturiibacter gelidiferens TaxID=3069689 RepID=UPI003D9BEC0A